MKRIIEKRIYFLKPNQIVCPNQFARKYYDPQEIKSLADNISSNGIIEPLIVRKNDVGKFELVAGLRRLNSAKLLGLRRVPCILKNISEETAAFISLSENIKRKNLNFFEEAEAIENVIRRFETSEFTACELLGIGKSALINKQNLLSLDKTLQNRIVRSGLSERHARVLLMLPEEKRSALLDSIISNSLDVQKSRELAEKILLFEGSEPSVKPPECPPPVRKTAIGDVRFFANSLSKLIITLQNSGVDIYSKKSENDKYIEYKVRISKTQIDNYQQLKLV